MKRKFILAYCFVLSLITLMAQTNLVPNPSFEDTVHCPPGSDHMNYSTDWSSYSASPDYFNSCCTPSAFGASVPINFGGYQQAASGNAYAGFITYWSLAPNYREIIGGQLSTPLNIGTKYFASFKIALSLSTTCPSNYATNKIGINFSTAPFSIFNPASITNSAKVYSTTIITDTLNWTRIFGSFIADSTYDYVMLGNFFDSTHTDTLKFMNSTLNIAYYYIDDICVSTDSAFTYNYVGINEINENPIIIISPNPASNYISINFPELTGKFNLSVYNIYGQTLFRTENINTSHLSIDISNYPDGILILQILYKEKLFNYKFIKQ